MSLVQRTASFAEMSKASAGIAGLLDSKKSLMTSSRLNLSAVDMMLFEFLGENGSAEIDRTVRMTDTKRRGYVSKACTNVAHRIVRDVGNPAGAELDRELGLELVRVVLLRARDVARGLTAASEDVLAMDVGFEKVVRTLRRTVPASSVPNSGRPRKPYKLASLRRYALRTASGVAWNVTGTALRGLVKATRPCTPWHDERTEKLLRMLTRNREVVYEGLEPEPERTSFLLSRRPSFERSLNALSVFGLEAPLPLEHREYRPWPLVKAEEDAAEDAAEDAGVDAGRPSGEGEGRAYVPVTPWAAD